VIRADFDQRPYPDAGGEAVNPRIDWLRLGCPSQARQFRVRGLAKVKAVALWQALAFNLLRLKNDIACPRCSRIRFEH
jgi:hypothetical protein